ncbi:MAG: efflux RND transporter permease subunit [Candidatus Thiodiazotropha sp.]|jgi:HAE1 family hydrophobic/amphiphilic exporter-1
MRDLIAFSLKQRIFYNLIFIVLMVGGIFALFVLPSERYPDFSFGKVFIVTTYPGASPEEVESLVTRKIEEAMELVDDVEWISSTSYNGSSKVRLKFFDDTDYDSLFNEVRFELMNIVNELPDETDPPDLLNLKVQYWLPVVTVNLVGDINNRALTLMAEEIKTRLLKIIGVQEVELIGSHTQEFHIHLDPNKLRDYGVSFEQVSQALAGANLTIPAGKFTDFTGEFMVKMDERFKSIEQVQSCVVRRDADGSLVTVADLATYAGLDYRDPMLITSVNGKPSVGLKVIKSEKGNAVEIRNQVMEVVNEFRPVLKANGVDMVQTQDTTVYIKDGLGTISMNMLVGMILVTVIVWYFMGIRNAGLITIGIPFAFLTTLLLMYLTGNSMNEITLFCLVLVSGIIVDDAIVVTENIYRQIQKGYPLQKAIVKGTSEVAIPVISATLTSVVAFLPLFIMTGATGQFFALIPKAVAFALTASLIECILILPIHYLHFGPRNQASVKLLESDNGFMKVARSITKRILKYTLRYRFSTVFVVILLFVISMGILVVSSTGIKPLIRIQFFPDDYKVYFVDVVGPTNSSIEKMDKIVKQIADTVMEDGPGMAAAASGMAGFYYNEDYESIYGNNHGTVLVTMPSTNMQEFDDPLEHLENMRERLKKIYEKDGFKLHVHPQKDGPPRGKDVNVRIVGENVEAVTALANNILDFMHESENIGPYLFDLRDDRGLPKRVFRLEVDQKRVAEFGLDNRQVAQMAASALDGRYQGKYRHIDEEIDLKLLIDPGVLSSPESALYIPVVEQAGRPIYLADLVKVRAYNESGEINRYQGQRAISIKADIREGAPTSTPAVVNEVKDYYDTIRNDYVGATVTFGGEHEDTKRSFESLGYAAIVTVILIYLILATQFQSYLQPIIILSAIVFALIGVVFGKFITQALFTVNSFVAMIGVAGVVVNDALVLIDFINRRYRRGIPRRKAIIMGVHIRLRPILLTTLTTSLGMLPMALGIPEYSVIWGAMATTFVTGLITATVLTLFVIPPLWDIMQDIQESIDARKKVVPAKQQTSNTERNKRETADRHITVPLPSSDLKQKPNLKVLK